VQSSMVSSARALAKRKLSEALPRRWRHVQAVTAKAERLSLVLRVQQDREALVASAALHDIGYAPSIDATGFHPLDGARWLREIGFNDRVAALVAHHTNALAEAEQRGLDKELSGEFDREASLVADLLWYCDLTTGPDGQAFTVEERIAEIRERYEPRSVVYEFITGSASVFAEVAKRVESVLPPAQPM
jgi:putative nucleotidyltransferase with HDIG domain